MTTKPKLRKVESCLMAYYHRVKAETAIYEQKPWVHTWRLKVRRVRRAPGEEA